MPRRELFLIEDDTTDQEIFFSALKEIDKSIFCHLATNGFIAITMLRQQLLAPALIFVDLTMPVCDGYEFLAMYSPTFVPTPPRYRLYH